MKHILLFAFISALAANCFSQITVTLADLPQSGYTYITSTDTTPSVSNGSPGPSFQTWNFSSLGSDYMSAPTYGPTSATPYASSFTASNIYTYGPAALYSSLFGGAPVSGQGMNKGYMFWKTDSTGFRIIGFRADSGAYSNINVYENPTELLIGTPATYGSAFSNTGRWELPMNLNSADVDTYYVSRVVKTLNYDAWGSITTPTSTYPNVVRMHEYAIKTDSVISKFGNTVVASFEVLRDTAHNYMYLANGIGYPVAIVHSSANYSIKDVEYYSVTLTTTSEISTSEMVNLYPNPANETVTLNFETAQVYSIQVFDAVSGKRVLEKNIRTTSENQKTTLEIKDLAAGIYIVKILGGNGKFSAIKLIRS